MTDVKLNCLCYFKLFNCVHINFPDLKLKLYHQMQLTQDKHEYEN